MVCRNASCCTIFTRKFRLYTDEPSALRHAEVQARREGAEEEKPRDPPEPRAQDFRFARRLGQGRRRRNGESVPCFGPQPATARSDTCGLRVQPRLRHLLCGRAVRAPTRGGQCCGMCGGVNLTQETQSQLDGQTAGISSRGVRGVRGASPTASFLIPER